MKESRLTIEHKIIGKIENLEVGEKRLSHIHVMDGTEVALWPELVELIWKQQTITWKKADSYLPTIEDNIIGGNW